MSISFKNSFNSGDLITMLPGMQKLYRDTGFKAKIYQRLDMPAYYYDDAKHPIRDKNDIQVCMNKATFLMMKPLLETQEYIESYEIWDGEDVQFNFDMTRHSSQIPLPAGDIHAWVTLIFPQLSCDLSMPWISVNKDKFSNVNYFENKVVVNRTSRYNNPYIDYYFLKDYEDMVVFVGMDFEYEKFIREFGLKIEYYKISNFLELANIIESSYLFLGNQSLAWHISDAMKKNRILEVCTAYPNSFPTGANGYSFVSQTALEYRFKQILKENKSIIL